MSGAHVVAGLNHNVRYRGKAYHAQTEDLGTALALVVTHLFEGGTVLAVKRASYADLLGGGELARAVRQLMERQHKDMLRDLVHGALDARLAASAAQSRSYQPGELAGVAASRGSAAVALAATPSPAAPAEEPDDSIDQAILAYLAGDHDDVE